MTPRDDCSRATGAGTPKVILKEAPRNKTELPPVPPERVAEHNVKQESKNKIPTSESKDEPEEEEPFQPDWDGDEEGVFTKREEKLIDGQRKITERKARFCKSCKTEVLASLTTRPTALSAQMACRTSPPPTRLVPWRAF